ncbi:hypothetical protein LCGC14_1078160 [marine sediment metagenome]|uniref:N-acetyltransferase domain-containing protein n=1 Tax=marine sediment metagenome TaxID=412755 RepID=A0A0F9PZB5_9ZZZZ
MKKFILRNARMTDANDLLALRKSVIAFFFGEVPTLENHKKWLKKTIADDNIILLAVMIEGRFAGQVKINEESGLSEISISLVKEYRHKGIATEIILAATEKTNCSVIALIQKTNAPSLKAFIRAGFGQ